MKLLSKALIAALAVAGVCGTTVSAQQIAFDNWQRDFDVTSQTFRNEQTLPLSTIFNSVTNGVNACTPDGSIGGNASPKLNWTPAARGTKSYAVVLFDETANFTHWGIYNIPPSVTALPADAGVAGAIGTQITNDFGMKEYDGPCPPPGLVHKYVFTVYALNTELNLPASSTFPANAETLFRALIGHVIEKTSVTGLYASTLK